MNDIDKLAEATKKSFDKVDKRFEQVDKRFEQVDKRFEQVDKRFKQVDKRFEQVDKQLVEIKQEMKAVEERIIHEFHVVAENIHQDVAGANKDEISLMKQKQNNLEGRVIKLEQKVH